MVWTIYEIYQYIPDEQEDINDNPTLTEIQDFIANKCITCSKTKGKKYLAKFLN